MTKKIGRNDPCPCGSGKKYKQCCLLKASKPKSLGSRVALHPSNQNIAKLGNNLPTPPPRPLKAVWVNRPVQAEEAAPQGIDLMERTYGPAISASEPPPAVQHPAIEAEDKESI